MVFICGRSWVQAQIASIQRNWQHRQQDEEKQNKSTNNGNYTPAPSLPPDTFNMQGAWHSLNSTLLKLFTPEDNACLTDIIKKCLVVI
jgi:hypothetical protein